MTDRLPTPPAALLCRAAQQLSALADPQRAALLSGALRLASSTQGCTVAALAADQGTDLRTAARHLAALEAAGWSRSGSTTSARGSRRWSRRRRTCWPRCPSPPCWRRTGRSAGCSGTAG